MIRPGDPENSIAWARDALNTGAIETAEEALATLKPGDRNTADYHDIAAHLAMVIPDRVKAESHWRDAVRLAPESEDFRLRLAGFRDDAVRLDVQRIEFERPSPVEDRVFVVLLFKCLGTAPRMQALRPSVVAVQQRPSPQESGEAE